jgi:hypothetical protein
MSPVFSLQRLTLASAKKTKRSPGWSGLTKTMTHGWSIELPRIRAWILAFRAALSGSAAPHELSTVVA